MTRASARECEEKESMRNIFHNCLPLHDAKVGIEQRSFFSCGIRVP